MKLPDEDVEPGDEDNCGRLLMSMYGTRDAAVNWHHEYVSALEGFGMKRGSASPCLFAHPKLDLSAFVHGDDFVAVGPGRAVAMLEGYLKNRYKVKAQVMGSGAGEEKELNTLNRIARYSCDKVTIEADPRHCKVIVREVGLTGLKGSRVPGNKEEAMNALGSKSKAGSKDDDDDDVGEPEYLDAGEAKQFRALTARLNYVASDRPDLQFAVKECAGHMARPQVASWHLLKTVARYLLYRPRLVLEYRFQLSPRCVSVFSDSDWAGCVQTRRSTSGGGLGNVRCTPYKVVVPPAEGHSFILGGS